MSVRDRLEPVAEPNGYNTFEHAKLSGAISLKRIADALENLVKLADPKAGIDWDNMSDQAEIKVKL